MTSGFVVVAVLLSLLLVVDLVLFVVAALIFSVAVESPASVLFLRIFNDSN